MTNSFYYLLPMIAAIGAVIQPLLNESIAQKTGHTTALFWNGITFGIFSCLFFALAKMLGPNIPEFFRIKSLEFDPIYFGAGFCGILIVAFLPPSIPVLGVGTTLTIFIVSQLLLSTAVDMAMGRVIDSRQWLGLVLAIAGVYLVTSKK